MQRKAGQTGHIGHMAGLRQRRDAPEASAPSGERGTASGGVAVAQRCPRIACAPAPCHLPCRARHTIASL